VPLFLGEKILLSLTYISFFLFGVIFGSFGNVLILRLPEEKSIIPPSRCTSCNQRIAWFDNIPLFSWLFLKGRCRQCSASISIQYPIVELSCGLLFVAIFHRFGMSYFTFELLIFSYFAFIAACIDMEHMILPDIFTLGGCAIGLLGAAINPDRSFYDGLFGFLLGGSFFFIIAYVGHLIYKQEVLGGGDIKLIAWIGSVLGAFSIPYTIAVSGILGALFGVGRFLILKKSLRDPVPYGPFLVFASFSYFLFDLPTIVQWLFSLPLNL
jgi:leader peptidase (prepilin peptidase) / N-methyltransferase